MKPEVQRTGGLPPRHILLVQPHQPTRQMLVEYLERHSYDVCEAECGREAVAMARLQLFDVLITDVSHSKDDTAALLDELRKLQPHVRVVAIGGEPVPGLDQFADGFHASVPGPIYPPAILAAISRVC